MRQVPTTIEFFKQEAEIPDAQLQLMTAFDNDDSFIQWEPIKEFCADIRKWKIQRLFLCTQKDSLLLSRFQRIQFSLLTSISISDNNLSSIEPLCRICMPCLKNLFAPDNQLTTVTALRKCHWPNLQELGIFRNFIVRIQKFPQLRLPQKIELVYLQILQNDRIQGEDCLWFFKAEANVVQEVLLKCRGRILFPAIVQEALRKRVINLGEVP